MPLQDRVDRRRSGDLLPTTVTEGQRVNESGHKGPGGSRKFERRGHVGSGSAAHRWPLQTEVEVGSDMARTFVNQQVRSLSRPEFDQYEWRGQNPVQTHPTPRRRRVSLNSRPAACCKPHADSTRLRCPNSLGPGGAFLISR